MAKDNIMTREEAEKIIRDNASKSLCEEIDELLENCDGYSLIDAFIQIEDCCDYVGIFDRAMVTNVRMISILLGMYVPISDEELSSIISNKSGKNYDFQMNKIKYHFIRKLEDIIGD